MNLFRMKRLAETRQLTDAEIAQAGKPEALPNTWRKPRLYKHDGEWVCIVECTKTYNPQPSNRPMYEPITCRGYHPNPVGAWWHMRLDMANNQPLVP